MKKWEFSVAVIIKGKTREEAEKKLDIILNQDHYLYNDEELQMAADSRVPGEGYQEQGKGLHYCPHCAAPVGLEPSDSNIILDGGNWDCEEYD